MQVLVATAATQGAQAHDQMNGSEGELVWLLKPCRACWCYPDGQCTCGRMFSGLNSFRQTSTAVIAEVPGLTREDLATAMRRFARARPDLICSGEHSYDAAIDIVLEQAALWPVGTVLGRRGNELLPRDSAR
jgi:hypothetical protein